MSANHEVEYRSVVFVAFDGFQLLDLAGPMQVFTTASEHARDGRFGRAIDYRISIVSMEGGSAKASSWVSFDTEPLPTSLAPNTTLMVIGGAGVETAMSNAAFIDWLRLRAGEAERICSICNGAFVLAKAGLLTGKRATTHWIDCDDLRRHYPDIEVDRDAIYVRDSNIWTSAGVSAGIDLALALVENDHGANAAAVTARRLVLYVKRPGNQSQFSEFIEVIGRDGDGVFGALHQWILDNIATDLRIPVLAQRTGMSERTFARKYLESVGVTPAETVNRLRADTARNYLRTSNTPMKAVAAKSGFGSVEHMNRVHLKVFGMSSRTIRETR